MKLRSFLADGSRFFGLAARSLRRRPAPLFLAVVLALGSFSSAQAQNAYVWANTGSTWSATNSWDLSGIPNTGHPGLASNDIAEFEGNAITDPNLTASVTLGELEFLGGATPAYNYTISTTNGSTLTFTGSTIISFATSGGTDTINPNIILNEATGSSPVITGNAGGLIVLNGSISSTANNVGLYIYGGQPFGIQMLITSSNNSLTGAITIGDAGVGTADLMVAALEGTNSSGAIAGSLGSGAIFFNDVGDVLDYVGSGETTTNQIINISTGGGNSTFSTISTLGATGALIIDQNLTNSNSTTLNLASNDNYGDTVNGIISNTNGTTVTLLKSGLGTWTLTGQNTYSGATYINGGNLVLSFVDNASNILASTNLTFNDPVNGTLLTGSANLTLLGSTNISSSNSESFSTLVLNAEGFSVGNIFGLAANVNLTSTNGNAVTLNLGSLPTTRTAGTTLNFNLGGTGTDAVIIGTNTAATTAGLLANAITLNGTDFATETTNSNGTWSLVSDTANYTSVANSATTLSTTKISEFDGVTTGNVTTVTVPSMIFNGTNASTLNIASAATVTANANNASAILMSANDGAVTNTISGGAITGPQSNLGYDLTLDQYDTTPGALLVINSAIVTVIGIPGQVNTATVGLTISGGGTVELTAANTFSGELSLNQGTLIVTGSNSLGFGGPTGEVGGNATGNRQAVVSVGAGATLEFDPTTAITVNKPIILNGVGGGSGGSSALLNDGSTVTIDNGVSYVYYGNTGSSGPTTTNVTLTFVGGGGSGATAYAATYSGNGEPVNTVMTAAGSGYTTAPTVTTTTGNATYVAVLSSIALNGTSNTIGGTGDIIINAAVSNGSVTTIPAGSASNGGFTKVGSDTVTLNGPNTYTGPTVIQGGTLDISSIGNGGIETDLETPNSASTNVTLFGNTSSATGVTITSNMVVGGHSGIPTTIPITSASSSTLVLSGDAGMVTNSRSTALIGFANGLGLSTSAASNLVLNGGTLAYTGTGGSTDRLFTLINSGTIASNGSGAFNFDLTNGATTYGGGTIAIGGTGTNNLTLGGSYTGTNIFAPTLIDGTGGSTTLTESGSGTWLLAGSNTYSGATTVTTGALGLTDGGSLGATTNTVSGGATFDVFSGGVATNGVGGTIGAGGSLIISGGGTLNMADGTLKKFDLTGTGSVLNLGTMGSGTVYLDLSVGGSGADEIVLGSGAVTVGTNGVVVTLTGLSGLADGSDTLISAGGGITYGAGFTLSSPTLDGYNVALVDNSNSLVLDVTGGAVIPNVAYWTGTTSASWQTSTNFSTSNGTYTPATESPASITDVVFASGPGTPANLSTTLDTNTTINSLTFSTGSNVTIASDSSNDGAYSLTLEAQTTTSSNGINTSPNGITDSDATGVVISAPIVLATNQTWTISPGDTLTVGDGVSDNEIGYNLTVTGGGTLVISGNIAESLGGIQYAGNTIVANGTLQLTTAGSILTTEGDNGLLTSLALGSSSNTTGVFVLGDNTSDPGAVASVAVSSLTAIGTGSNAVVGGSSTNSLLTYEPETSSNDTFGGAIGGSGLYQNNLTLIVNNNGNGSALTLTGTNTYTGGTQVQDGTLILGAGGSLSTSNTLVLGSGSSNGVFVLGSGSTAVNTTVTSLTTSGTGTGNAVQGGASAVSTLTVNVASGTDTFSGTLGGSTTTNNNLALTKLGLGTLALTGTNTYTGGTTIDAGVLKFASLGSVGATNSTVTFDGVSSTSNATLDYTGGNGILAQNLTVSTGGFGTVENGGSGVLDLTGSISKNGSVLTLEGGKFVVSGVISGSSNNSDLDLNNAQVALTTTNTYNGPTSIANNSYLLTTTNNALPTAPASDVTFGTNTDSGVTNTLDLAGTSETVGSLFVGSTNSNVINQVISSASTGSGTNLTTTNTASTTQGTLTVTTSTNDTFSGSLGGSGSATNFGLVMNGTGTLTLSGTNTYTGPTTVTTGTLLITGSTLSPITTINRGTLQGNGFVKGIVVNSGGNITPGAAGFTPQELLSSTTNNVLTATSLTLNGGASLTYNLYSSTVSPPLTQPLGGNVINLSGGLLTFGTLTDSSSATELTLDFNGSGTVGFGTLTNGNAAVYDLITDFSSSNLTAAQLNSDLSDGAIVLNNLTSYGMTGTNAIPYADFVIIGSAGDYTLQLDVVPEPGAWAMFALGLGLLFFTVRKRLGMTRKPGTVLVKD